MSLRIGLGFDRHRLVSGRPMILGGVQLPGDRGLLGHSDADALLHAACDAVLGAAGLDDIGSLFPDKDPAFSGADSKVTKRRILRRRSFERARLRAMRYTSGSAVSATTRRRIFHRRTNAS